MIKIIKWNCYLEKFFYINYLKSCWDFFQIYKVGKILFPDSKMRSWFPFGGFSVEIFQFIVCLPRYTIFHVWIKIWKKSSAIQL